LLEAKQARRQAPEARKAEARRQDKKASASRAASAAGDDDQPPVSQEELEAQSRLWAEAKAARQDPKYDKSAISSSPYNLSRSPQAAVSLQSSSANSKPSAAAHDSSRSAMADELQRRALAEAKAGRKESSAREVASASPVETGPMQLSPSRSFSGESHEDWEPGSPSRAPVPSFKRYFPPRAQTARPDQKAPVSPVQKPSAEPLTAGPMLKGDPKASPLASATASPQVTTESAVSSAPTSDPKTRMTTQVHEDEEPLCNLKGDQEGCLSRLQKRFWRKPTVSPLPVTTGTAERIQLYPPSSSSSESDEDSALDYLSSDTD
jgi:hypothetical protein